ncbi:hypothetical protein U8Q05_27010 (plasmid) [Rhizobium ruizarguesonis]|nr:hypothetical protein U8Q05_27010 [Rhizobium ruizarguesonis]
MSESQLDVRELLELEDDALWGELGKAVQYDGLGMLPEELDRRPNEPQIGRWFFKRQLSNIRKIYCTNEVARLVPEDSRRDAAEFVAALIDLFAAYFGARAGTIILVKIYKTGVDRFCDEVPSADGL